MSYTRSRGSATTRTRTRTKESEVELEDDGVPKCTGHNKRAKDFVAGQHTKNAGRKFYTCALPRDDPTRCGFFQWADQFDSGSTHKPSGGQTLGGQPLGGRALGGRNPDVYGVQGATGIIARVQERYGRTPSSSSDPSASSSGSASLNATTPTATRMSHAPITPQTGSRTAAHADVVDEIDWDKVDTDSLERDAIASSPASSQKRSSQPHSNAETLQDRLHAAAQTTPTAFRNEGGKRKREEDEAEVTPKRAVRDGSHNPFLSLTTFTSPPHHALSPSLSQLDQLSEHLHRQDRLIHAGEVAKEGFRKTIQKQKERIAELEARVKELEGK